MRIPKKKKRLDEAICGAAPFDKPAADFKKWRQDHAKAVQLLKSQAQPRTSAGDNTIQAIQVWRIIMKSRITKLAAAAVIVIGVLLVGVIYLSPSDEVSLSSSVSGSAQIQADSEGEEIPVELAQMPVEKLLEIHFGNAESPYESSMVAAAVAKVLDNLSAREILAIGQKYGKEEGLFACWAGEDPLSLPLAVEVSDFIVRARVDDAAFDVSDLKKAILKRDSTKISGWVGLVKTTIDLHISEVYPSRPWQFEDKISFQTVVTTEELDMFEEGKEYLIGLRRYGDIIWWTSRPKVNMKKFACPIDPNSGIVSGLKNGSMSLNEAWEFVMDTYDAIHEGKLPSGEVLDYWLAKLKSDDLTDCWSAVDYFGTLREPIVPQDLVVGLVERLPKLLSYSILTEELGKTAREDIDQLLVDMGTDPAAYEKPDTDSQQLVWSKKGHPDPRSIGMLRAELKKEVTGELLSALFACGAQDEAVEMGLAEIEKLISGEMNFYQCRSLISFLGTTGDKSVLPTIEYFVHEDVMETYREDERLLQNAVLALGRLGAKSTIPRLKELYESKDVDISVKIAAALSLYCLGDDTGYELLEHFVNGTERSIPEIQWKPADKIFQEPIVYLESTRTDELLLESFRSSHFRPTLYYHIAGKYIDHRTYAFARVYQTDLLPVLVEQLNNRDRVTRKYVNTMLKRLTGQDFGFRPDKFVLQQTEAIEQWRAYVDEYLAKSDDSGK